jgi:hypothetical protein
MPSHKRVLFTGNIKFPKLPKFFEHWAFSQNAQFFLGMNEKLLKTYHHLPFFFFSAQNYQTKSNLPQNCLIFFSSIRNFPEYNILRFFYPIYSAQNDQAA